MAEFALQGGQPVVRELAARKTGGPWAVLGRNLSPEFEVSTGKRRISTTQTGMMAKQKTDTPENEDARKWDTFWDAPLVLPGGNSVKGTPRDPNEIRQAKSQFSSDTCNISTEGDRISVTFNGLKLGIFAGDLQFTAYKHSNLLRQEAIAKTDQPRCGLHLQGRVERLRNRQQHQAGLARYAHETSRSMSLAARRTMTGESACPQSAGDTGYRQGLTCRVSRSAQILFRARERSESWLCLLPKGRCRYVLTGRHAA